MQERPESPIFSVYLQRGRYLRARAGTMLLLWCKKGTPCPVLTHPDWCKVGSRNGQHGNLTKWFQLHSEMQVPFILAQLREVQ